MNHTHTTVNLGRYSGQLSGSANTAEGTTPSIQPNRQRVEKKFPSLGFTINTDGHPFYEVLLTTNRQLFHPERAGERDESTFYSSRHDGGLLSAAGESEIYLVPLGVIHRFASVKPPVNRIYFTLIAYADAEGNSPVFSHNPMALPQEAPYVLLDPAVQAASAFSRLKKNSLSRYSPSSIPVADVSPPNHQSNQQSYKPGLNPSDNPENPGDYGIEESLGYDDEEYEDFIDNGEIDEVDEIDEVRENFTGTSGSSTSYGEDFDYDDGFGPIGNSQAPDEEQDYPEIEEEFELEPEEPENGDYGTQSSATHPDNFSSSPYTDEGEDDFDWLDDAPAPSPLQANSMGRGRPSLTQQHRLNILETIPQ